MHTDDHDTDLFADDRDQDAPVRLPVTSRPAVSPRPAQPKASYESNADVQRWLREQERERVGAKPPFDPTFLAHQRDRPWVLSSLAHFYDDDLITDVLAVVKSGKEATVYLCTAHPATGFDMLAAKVYRPRMFRSLRNDAIYRESREQPQEQWRSARPGRRPKAPRNTRSQQARASQVSDWIAYEYHTQQLLHVAGADIPQPVAQVGNALLMEYVGGMEAAAPLLRQVTLAGEEAQALFQRVLSNIALFLSHNRVHGDLSAYNMLYWQGAITIIDLAQAVDPRHSESMYPVLARDIARVCAYFARCGVEADAETLALDLWQRYQHGEL